MKYLILGVDGMLGHVLFDRASHFGEVRGTTRRNYTDKKNVYKNVDATNFTIIEEIITEFKPDFVVNCIGIIKQLEEARNAIISISVNSLYPHQLSEVTRRLGTRLIHISTDCVFSGNRGNYSDDDTSDATDLYGRTKFLGEIGYENCLTIRTSIIGHELSSNRSLVDWFLTQTGSCKGFQHAIFSGFPTKTLADLLLTKITEAMMKTGLQGVYNLSSDPISKYDLLVMIAKEYGKKIEILPETNFMMDRSLDSERLRKVINFKPACWEDLIHEMHEHFIKTGYRKFKKEYHLESL